MTGSGSSEAGIKKATCRLEVITKSDAFLMQISGGEEKLTKLFQNLFQSVQYYCNIAACI